MDMLVIQGGAALQGDVTVEGAKNAALPIMAAALAVRGDVRLGCVPDLVDVHTMTQLLQSLGAEVDRSTPNSAVINADNAQGHVADYELVRRMRASICVLGPLLARHGRARVSLPGGCNIGHRPIDLHLKGLAALGADLRIEAGYVIATAAQLRGAEVDLSGPHGSTVTGTCNVMVAAALAKGQTVIRSAACEPEVVDVGRFLINAGAKISGLGTPVVEIEGVDSLTGSAHKILPDRIEAATFAIAATATHGSIRLKNVRPSDLTSVTNALSAMDVEVSSTVDELRISTPRQLKPANITARPFPGIPTDTQAQFMALLATIRGRSVVTDGVFPDRFMHASELLRMGAHIRRVGASAVVTGGTRLSGASVMASDLRASAALVIAALTADGESQIRRIYHLDRGYAGLETKLNALGANVRRESDRQQPSAVKAPHYSSQSARQRTDS
ncbi:UDP-N-acetylglucosamine 1-carboxyvinyltransferase [Fuerstiella marisgermanici]|nr:UDP-N-acetylglucosamine 1-carboxyvinyltransferase [Fuerstiella marisgermanici]